MERSRKLFGVLFLMMLVQLSCAIPAGIGGNNTQETQIALGIKATMLAQQQQTLDAGGGSNEVITHTPYPTITAGSQAVIPPTKTAIPTTDTKVYAFKLLSETIPDGTFYTPGERFTKTWTIRNDSDSAWNKDFTLDFVNGDRMSGTASTKLVNAVDTSATVTLSVDLIAPNVPGQYTAHWQVSTDKGAEVGSLSVAITVGENQAGPGFLTVDVTFPFANKSVNMACPGSVDVTANVTTNTAGTLTCTWLNSSQANGGQITQNVTFAGAGTKTIGYTVGPIGYSDTYDVHFYCENEGMRWDYGPIPIYVTCY